MSLVSLVLGLGPPGAARTSPASTMRLVVTRVSQATRASGSALRKASTTVSEMRSPTLSGMAFGHAFGGEDVVATVAHRRSGSRSNGASSLRRRRRRGQPDDAAMSPPARLPGIATGSARRLPSAGPAPARPSHGAATGRGASTEPRVFGTSAISSEGLVRASAESSSSRASLARQRRRLAGIALEAARRNSSAARRGTSAIW